MRVAGISAFRISVYRSVSEVRKAWLFSTVFSETEGVEVVLLLLFAAYKLKKTVAERKGFGCP